MSDSIVITMPLPPSVNRLTGNRTGGKGRYSTAAYRAWKRAAGWEVMAQLAGRRLPLFSGRFELTITAPRRLGADCDNRAKAVADLLVSLGVVIDDRGRFMDGVAARWTDDRPDLAGRCEVRVTQTAEMAVGTGILARRAVPAASAAPKSGKHAAPATGKRRGSKRVSEKLDDAQSTAPRTRKECVLRMLRRQGINVPAERVHVMAGRES